MKKDRKLAKHQLNRARTRFYKVADTHPELEFLLTRVGCGIAGQDEIAMRKRFYNAPSNIIKPIEWRGEL